MDIIIIIIMNKIITIFSVKIEKVKEVFIIQN